MKEREVSIKQKLLLYQERVFKETGLWGKKFGRVLDIGCGRGDDAKLFAQWDNQVTAIDIEKSPKWNVEPLNSSPGASRSKGIVTFETGDGENLSFRSSTFDLVFSKDVLHHTYNPEKMLKEAKRVCKSGGLIVFVEANRYNPITFLHMTKSLGHNHLSRNQFRQLVLKTFSNARINAFEAHYYPAVTPVIAKALSLFEKEISKVPWFKNLFSYNFFLAKK